MKVHDHFAVADPDHRASAICAVAGFVGGAWMHLTWDNRVLIGRAIQEEFPGMEFEDLFARLQGVDYRPLRTNLLAAPIRLPKLDLEAIRARAMKKAGVS